MKKKQHIEYIIYNIDICEHVVLQAELTNKGRHCHDINQWLVELKYLLKKIQKKKPENVKITELSACTKIAQFIGYSLWLLEQGK